MNITVSELAALIREVQGKVDARDEMPRGQVLAEKPSLDVAFDQRPIGYEVGKRDEQPIDTQKEADAALGRKVRNMPEHSRLKRDRNDANGGQRWIFYYDGSFCAYKETPDEVLLCPPKANTP
jgi:hypothetical protein